MTEPPTTIAPPQRLDGIPVLHPIDDPTFMGPPGRLPPGRWAEGSLVVDYAGAMGVVTERRRADRCWVYWHQIGVNLQHSAAQLRLVFSNDLDRPTRMLADMLGYPQFSTAPGWEWDTYIPASEGDGRVNGFVFSPLATYSDGGLDVCERGHWNLDQHIEEIAGERFGAAHGWDDDDPRWDNWLPTTAQLDQAYAEIVAGPYGADGYLVTPGIKDCGSKGEGLALTIEYLHRILPTHVGA